MRTKELSHTFMKCPDDNLNALPEVGSTKLFELGTRDSCVEVDTCTERRAQYVNYLTLPSPK